MSEAPDAELVRRTIRGHRESFRPLVCRYQDKVYLLACSCLHDPSEAQDVVQETFYVAYRKLPKLRDPNKFASWLFGVARNLCHVYMRKRRLYTESTPLETVEDRLKTEPEHPYGPATTVVEEHDELLALLHEGLNNLPDKYQTLLRLKYLSGMSYQDISGITDLPVQTIRSRLFEGRRLLKEQLQIEARHRL